MSAIKNIKSFSAVLAVSLCVACSADGGKDEASVPAADPSLTDLNVKWQAPSKRIDGTAMSPDEITHYTVSYTETKTGKTGSVTINFGESTHTVLKGMPQGQYEFSITATDTNNRTSAPAKVEYTL